MQFEQKPGKQQRFGWFSRRRGVGSVGLKEEGWHPHRRMAPPFFTLPQSLESLSERTLKKSQEVVFHKVLAAIGEFWPHVYACVLSCFSWVRLCDPMDCSLPGSSVHGNSLGKNTGVSCHALLQGIFPTQGLNLCFLWLLHCRWILYC